MPLDLALDLAHALDPVGFVQDRLKFAPDPWQARLLRSRAPWSPAQLLPAIRQVDDDGSRGAPHGDLRSRFDPARQSEPAAVQGAVRQGDWLSQGSRAGRGARR